MKCPCGGNIVRKTGIVMNTREFGPVFIPGIQFDECDRHGEPILLPEEGDKIVDYLQRRTRKALEKMKVTEFADAKTASQEFGLNMGEFVRNKAMRRRIYCLKLAGQWYFLRRSLKLYKATGDGRFYLGRSGF